MLGSDDPGLEPVTDEEVDRLIHLSDSGIASDGVLDTGEMLKAL